MTHSVLKFIFEYGERRGSKKMFFLGEGPGAWLNSLVALPFRGAKCKEENSLLKVRIGLNQNGFLP